MTRVRSYSDCNVWVHLLTGSMPNGYGPLKTPLTLGSNVSKAFVWRVLFLQCKKQVEKQRLKHHRHTENMFLSVCVCFTDNSRPLLICEHSLDAPARSKYVERLGETVVVNQPGVDREEPHHQDDVTSVEERRPYLWAPETQPSAKTNLPLSALWIREEQLNPASLLDRFFFCFFSVSTIHKAKRLMTIPWPRSPNITANRKGNVMMV